MLPNATSHTTLLIDLSRTPRRAVFYLSKYYRDETNIARCFIKNQQPRDLDGMTRRVARRLAFCSSSLLYAVRARSATTKYKSAQSFFSYIILVLFEPGRLIQSLLIPLESFYEHWYFLKLYILSGLNHFSTNSGRNETRNEIAL